MFRKTLVGLSVMAVAAAVACGESKSPASPTGAASPGSGVGPNAETLKIAAPPLVSPINGFQPAPGTPVVFTLTNVSGTYSSFPVTYEIEVRNAAGVLVANAKFPAAAGSTTSYTNTATLAPETVHTWQVRATYNGAFGPWSATGTFKSAIQAFINSSTSSVFDPMTTGFSVGKVRGGHFSSQGWTADGYGDGIDYDLAPCPSCRVEFDITGVGNGLGYPADLKFLSMGNAAYFDDFGAFRNGPWKTTLEQRGDGDGTGMKLIWRIDDDDDDHDTKFDCCGPAWKDEKVFHFVIQWTPSSYLITINGEEWFSGDLQDAYVPPNFRVSLGCYPRNETLKGATWRNVKISPF
jgi:hypothetical protein